MTRRGRWRPCRLPTFIAVSPTPADWPAERVASFYREYNRHMVHNLMVHEAMPGHYLQLQHARRFAGATRARAALWSGSFVEGWAVYAEELMADHGYPGERDPAAVRMQQLKMQLRMVINAILDARVHAHGMTEAEAMALMMERGFQEDGEAAGKWRRAQLTSAQLSTYYVGYTEISDLAAELLKARPRPEDRPRQHARPRVPARPAPPHAALAPTPRCVFDHTLRDRTRNRSDPPPDSSAAGTGASGTAGSGDGSSSVAPRHPARHGDPERGPQPELGAEQPAEQRPGGPGAVVDRLERARHPGPHASPGSPRRRSRRSRCRAPSPRTRW